MECAVWDMISWERVNELREDVGDDDFDEVVEIFLEEVEEVIDRLRQSPDPSKLEDDLHFLKGSALNLGFESFSKICQKGERDAANSNISAIDLRAVISVYERSKVQYFAQARTCFSQQQTG